VLLIAKRFKLPGNLVFGFSIKRVARKAARGLTV